VRDQSIQRNENHILASLSPEEYERLAPHMEAIALPSGQILYHAGQPIDHVYFPHKAMISLVSEMTDGASIEVGVVGFEGMSGLSLVLGVNKSPYENMVQIHDGATRIKAQAVVDEFKRGDALQSLLLRYTQSLLLQTSQVAACNRLHSMSERLARWLLMSHDRCFCEDLPLTQEFLSLMLGVRRAGVTETACILQSLGYINYKRGHIQITNREGLEEIACDCYRIVKADFDRITA
jgi:CRP-like cAMP-binding protein